MQEIENHFSGKRKLPKSLKRSKEPVNDDPFPKFDITHWESNEKFEESLKKHGVSQKYFNRHHHQHPHNIHPLGMKSKVVSGGKIPKNSSKAVVNDDDYDTPL